MNYTLSIHSSVQLLFMDDCEVNNTSFPELTYAPADALITLAKQCMMEERFNIEDVQSKIRQSVVSVHQFRKTLVINKKNNLYLDFINVIIKYVNYSSTSS